MTEAPAVTPHPAKFSDPILAHLVRFLNETQTGQPRRLLDPFCGIGRVHELSDHVPNLLTYGVELEPEWADQHPRTATGDSHQIAGVVKDAWDLDPGSFDLIATSPAYGNRMADQYDGRDGSRRMTYRLSLGREPSPNSSTTMQFGRDYQRLHAEVWSRCIEMLRPGGLFLLNVSNHIRGGDEVPVVEWHLTYLLQACGLFLVRTEPIRTRRMGDGANREARAASEHLLILRRG